MNGGWLKRREGVNLAESLAPHDIISPRKTYYTTSLDYDNNIRLGIVDLREYTRYGVSSFELMDTRYGGACEMTGNEWIWH